MKNHALWYRRFGRPEEALTLEAHEIEPPAPGRLRVRMALTPINPSDLIPITGAYRHRVAPPLVAGYEGLGVVAHAEGASRPLMGKRVLPLRGAGTWQRFVDCDPAWAVPVPDDVDDETAARGYINPLAAHLMLRTWNPEGRRVLITAAGSCCGRLLGQWALARNAREVAGIHRSPHHAAAISRLGVIPIAQDDSAAVVRAAHRAGLILDAVGGPLATALLGSMSREAVFVSYGLLSEEMFEIGLNSPRVARFHLRDAFEELTAPQWQSWFLELWNLLGKSRLPDVERFPLARWRNALGFFRESGRQAKPILTME